ncbi:MAG: FAD-dependent oxidoreductase [Ignavibacteriaceae bacterium]
MEETALINYDVLVIGGGCSGCAAGIASARLGAKTLIVEETPWLGGMITAAGVSAFDGNKYALGGGIFGELRKKIEDYYGGADKTFTGWISLTCFEPTIGAGFIKELADTEKDLEIWYRSKVTGIFREGDRITGAMVQKETGEEVRVFAKAIIEATEYGDVLEMGRVPYRIGRDSRKETKEKDAPEEWDGEVQDMTFCVTLKKYEGKAPEVAASLNYHTRNFKNATEVDSDTKDEKCLNHKLHSWDSFISYAALPNDKYLLNWPFRSNDYPTTLDIYLEPETREEHFRKAKELALDFVHYMQTKLGHPEWGIATDEYPTEDNLPFIPYVRESRRVKGIKLMVEDDVIPTKGSYRPPPVKSSIAVGDYFLDHHHSKAFLPPGERLEENYPDNAPFQVPFEVLIPEKVDGLVVAEKSISVTHIVNGCTRLQPVVMLIGQAAGVIAALSAKEGKEAREVSVEEVQEILLKGGCQLFPYKDLFNTDPKFEEIQKKALSGEFVDNKEFKYY